MTDQPLELDPLLNRAPKHISTIHIMGICGTAMGAIAGMLQQSGYQVTGSDAQVYPPMSDFLEQIGVRVFSGYKPENLAHAPDLVVVGNVISKTNPEARALAAAAIPYLSMPQTLSRLFIDSRTSLVITGTHGKTTTSSMLASALFSAGADPSFMIGGILREFNANYRIGNGPYFVSEGDEYDTAFFDKESKFLHYRPDIAVITSLEFDHADIFADLEAIKRSFRKFIRLLPPDGLIIANLEDINVAEVLRNAPCTVQSYGLSAENDWQIADIRHSAGKATFDLLFKGARFSDMIIRQPGRYNCMNAAAVSAVMHHLGISAAAIRTGLENFPGVKRRQEIRGIVRDIIVMDDFAHHPTAVKETLFALKQAYPNRRLVAVFEPRTNTSRRSIFQQQYVSSFQEADIAIIKEPPTDKRIDKDDRFSSARLACDIRELGNEAYSCATTDEILDLLKELTRPGDIIAILSNGGFDNIHERLLTALKTTPHI